MTRIIIVNLISTTQNMFGSSDILAYLDVNMNLNYRHATSSHAIQTTTCLVWYTGISMKPTPNAKLQNRAFEWID